MSDTTSKKGWPGQEIPGGNTWRLSDIPIDQLKVSELNNLSSTDIQELADSILKFGLITPLTVIDAAGGKYEILSGKRRFLAMSLLHEQDASLFSLVPCMIRAEISDIGTKELMIHLANQDTRTNYDRFQIISLLDQFCRAKQIREKDLEEIIGKIFGISDRYVRMYLRIARDGTENLKDAVIAGRRGKDTVNSDANLVPYISIREANKIARVSGELQEIILEKIRNGMSADDAYDSVAGITQ